MKIKIVKPTGEVESHDAGIEASFEPFENERESNEPEAVEKQIEATEKEIEKRLEKAKENSEATKGEDHVGEEITESFKNRKELSSRIQSLKAEGIAFKVNRSATEGMRYDLTYAKPLVEEEGDAVEVTDEVNVEEPIEAKHVGAEEIESIVREIASKYNGEGSEAKIGVDEFSKEGEGDRHIKLTVLGGLNGFGEWDKYLTALGSFLSDIKEATGWNPRVEELASDIVDDTFSVTLHLYDEEMEGSIEESIGKLREWYDGRKAEAEIGESVEEGAEGKRVEGKEYVIFDASEEGKAPILDIRSTRVEAESRANELKKTGEYDSVSFDEAPKGRFHKGDDFWGPFEGGDWHLKEEKKLTGNDNDKKSTFTLHPVPSNYEFVRLTPFDKAVKHLKLTDDDVEELKSEMLRLPPEASLGSSVFKFRFSPKKWNVGKSGGSRVIYIEAIVSNKAYLVTMYRKNEKEDLTPNELKEVRNLSDVLNSVE